MSSYGKRGSTPPTARNHVWAYEFVFDACHLPNEFPERWIPDWMERVYPSLGDRDWRPRLPEIGVPGACHWPFCERPAE